MFIKTHIRKHERGLRFLRGDFVEVLQPGTHYNFAWLWYIGEERVEKVDTLKTRFEHSLLDVLIQDPALRDELLIVDLADGERAIVWKDDRLLAILGPGRYAYWKTPAKLSVEIHKIETFRFDHPKLQAIIASPGALLWFEGVMV